MKNMKNIKEIIVQKINKTVLNYEYRLVPDTYGVSAHKQRDIKSVVPFYSLANKVIDDKKTLLYYDRLYNIYQSILNIQSLGYSKMNVVEIGVYKGGGSFFIANVLDWFKLDLNMLSIDTFEGHDKQDIPFGTEGLHNTQLFKDTNYIDVVNYLSCFKFVKVIKNRIQACNNEFDGIKFHFVHLDVDIFHPTYYSLNLLKGCLITNGIIMIDDYNFLTSLGVKKAVDKFMNEHKGEFLKVEYETGQCMLIKVK